MELLPIRIEILCFAFGMDALDVAGMTAAFSYMGKDIETALICSLTKYYSCL